ncbi:hypothetical protein B0H15DRAFT_541206 [Mycena belliarum]|uniref:Uncharacterized protein n=1 Tax=Mycena belliarum TaxID=1033014 RepID=A0AAD6XS02_9AGAR|nr:hypothetical protein B0H15DRAFT_541206 [Mycena belliae]
MGAPRDARPLARPRGPGAKGGPYIRTDLQVSVGPTCHTHCMTHPAIPTQPPARSVDPGKTQAMVRALRPVAPDTMVPKSPPTPTPPPTPTRIAYRLLDPAPGGRRRRPHINPNPPIYPGAQSEKIFGRGARRTPALLVSGHPSHQSSTNLKRGPRVQRSTPSVRIPRMKERFCRPPRSRRFSRLSRYTRGGDSRTWCTVHTRSSSSS